MCGCCKLKVVRTRGILGHVVGSRSSVQVMSFGFGIVRMRCGGLMEDDGIVSSGEGRGCVWDPDHGVGDSWGT